MKTYTKDGVTYQLFCRCDEYQRAGSDYPNEGEYDVVCRLCGDYPWYYPDKPLFSSEYRVIDTADCVEEEETDEEEGALECDSCSCSCSETHNTVDGDVCPDCFSDYVMCTDCEEFVLKEDSQKIDGDHVCHSCYEESYFTCERCGDTHHENHDHSEVITRTRDYRRDQESETWCESCVYNYAYTCDDCNEICSESAIATNSNITLCGNCIENYRSCAECGDYVHEDSINWDDDSDEYYCNHCYSSTSSSSIIKSYNYKPYPQFHGEGLHLGVELEMECTDREETAQVLAEMSNDEDLFYIKSDGSLNNGIEVVTHPCTLDFHQNEFGWDELCKTAVGKGARSHDTSTCGIHVHLSRAFFTLTEITRFTAFVNVHGDHLKKLARRGASDYSKFKNKNQGTKNLVEQSERYEAVNLYNNNTLEVRIFKGTLKVSTLLACIEVCDAMARFVKTSNISSIIVKSEENWGEFLSYVTNNLEMYSNLVLFMQSRGLLPKPIVSQEIIAGCAENYLPPCEAEPVCLAA